MKTCSQCGEAKEYAQFSNKKSALDGKHPYCNACMSLYSRKRYQENKEHLRKKHRDYYSKNKELYYYHVSKRRAAKKNAVPAWADLETIKGIYKIAQRVSRETGELYCVDHIVPLQGKLVCGLHCEDNLQLLKDKENKVKSNNHNP